MSLESQEKKQKLLQKSFEKSTSIPVSPVEEVAETSKDNNRFPPVGPVATTDEQSLGQEQNQTATALNAKRYSMYTSSIHQYQEAYGSQKVVVGAASSSVKLNASLGGGGPPSDYVPVLQESQNSPGKRSDRSNLSQRVEQVRRLYDGANTSKQSYLSNNPSNSQLPQQKQGKARRTMSEVESPDVKNYSSKPEVFPKVSSTSTKVGLATHLTETKGIEKVKKVYNSNLNGTPQVGKSSKGFTTHHLNKRNMQSQVEPCNPKLDQFDKLNEADDEDDVSRFTVQANTQRNQQSEKLPQMKLPTIADGKKSVQKIDSVLSSAKMTRYQVMSLGARTVKRSQHDTNGKAKHLKPSTSSSALPQPLDSASVKQKRNSQAVAVTHKFSSSNAGMLSKQEIEMKHDLHKEIVSLTNSYNQSIGEHLSRYHSHAKNNSVDPSHPGKILIHQNSTGSLKSSRQRNRLRRKVGGGTVKNSGTLESKEIVITDGNQKKTNSKQQVKKEQVPSGARSNKKLEKMNHNLVNSNGLTSVGGSNSLGLPVGKKKFPNRFPSTSRAPAEAISVATIGILPSIVSPSQGTIGKATSGEVSGGALYTRKGSNSGQMETNFPSSPILLESNEHSDKKKITSIPSLKQSKKRLATNTNTVDSIPEVKKALEITTMVSDFRNRSSNRAARGVAACIISPPSGRSENFNSSSYSKNRKPDFLSLSPDNKLNPYTQAVAGSSTTKQKSLKRVAKDQQRTYVPSDGIDLPHHQDAQFKNYTLTKKNDYTLVNFQPVDQVKARVKQLENSSFYDDLQDSSRLKGVHKSTRSQAKRNLTIGPNQSLNSAAMKGINSTTVMPYQIKMKGAGLSQDKYSKSKGKHLNRSKLQTPVAPLVPGLQNSQNPRNRQILANLQQQNHSRQTSNDGLEPTTDNTTTFEPSQQIAMSNNNRGNGSKSHSRTGTRSNFVNNGDQGKSQNIILQKRDAKGYLRNNNSILPPTTDNTSSNRIGQVNLSQNVSRVKKRLDVAADNARSSQPGRNLSQLHSRQVATTSTTTPQNVNINSKKQQQSLSKPTIMAEKTTEDSLGWQKEEGSYPKINDIIEEASPNKTSILSQQTSTRNSLGNGHTTTNDHNSQLPRPIQNLNQASVMESVRINQNRKKSSEPNNQAGSKLEPKMTKDSINLKNMAVEKRLKNSETAPDELSPTLPAANEGNRLVKDSKIHRPSIPPANMPAPRHHGPRNIAKSQINTQEKETNNKLAQTAGGMRKQISHDHSFTGLQSRKNLSRENDLTKDRRAEQQAKVNLAQLRNFRNCIDTRRQQNPDKQPLELKEFMIGLQVGQGAFAIVRRAVHKQTKHIIAIKTYDKKNLADAETQQAVHREINTLSDLWHPSIMKLHEVVDQRTHVHLVMEMCQGSSIYHHIKKVPDQRLPEATCKQIFRQLVQGVSYLHSKGYAHRDLKLDNILMDTATKTVKIIDFGFSLRAPHDSKLNIFCGTPHYMDPDIVRKQPYNGPAADVWACGVILYIIYVGKLPFFGEFEADLFRKIQNGKFTAVPTDLGDEKIRSLFRRIFDVNPSTRYTAQQVLEHSWVREHPPKNENAEQERSVPDQP